jgi:hypothetical protein
MSFERVEYLVYVSAIRMIAVVRTDERKRGSMGVV